MVDTTHRLLFVTGTRADFGKLEPLARAAMARGHQVDFFVTGMHMLDRYGLTRKEVAALKGATTHEFQNQTPGDPQDLVLANTVTGFSDFVRGHRPDLVIVHGDRVEALACALVCATNYIRCAHVEGGEISGTIDEIFRHCNTKLAFCHFVSSEDAAMRVRRLGEPADSIYAIGSPELDFHSGPSGVSIDEVRTRYEIPFGSYGIVTFHPVTSEQATMAQQGADFFAALTDSGRNFVVILPNNDPGADGILAAIDRLPKARFRVFPSMRFGYFSELMKHAACVVGNSSAGVREAPFLGVPSLDIGTRQYRRASGVSITTCEAGDHDVITRFLRDEWGRVYPRDPAFGDGRAAEKFADLLTRPEFWDRPLQKTFSDYGG